MRDEGQPGGPYASDPGEIQGSFGGRVGGAAGFRPKGGDPRGLRRRRQTAQSQEQARAYDHRQGQHGQEQAEMGRPASCLSARRHANAMVGGACGSGPTACCTGLDHQKGRGSLWFEGNRQQRATVRCAISVRGPGLPLCAPGGKRHSSGRPASPVTAPGRRPPFGLGSAGLSPLRSVAAEPPSVAEVTVVATPLDAAGVPLSQTPGNAQRLSTVEAARQTPTRLADPLKPIWVR